MSRCIHLMPLLVMCCVVQVMAAERAPIPTHADVIYAQHPSGPLKLDLYLPNVAGAPLIVWVHGGAWRAGSKSDVPLLPLVGQGYAIASIEYRLSPVAPFPAQILDIKAALRFLRASADRWGYDRERFVLAGASAGGHLAALAGVTHAHPTLDAASGPHGEVTTNVQAIVNLYGPANLTTILEQSTVHGLGVRVPALQLLLGGQPDQKPDLARLASPVLHVDAKDPPMLIIHGDRDIQVPINQSHELHAAYKQAGRPVMFHVVHGGGHGGRAFYDAPTLQIIDRFLREHLPSRGGQDNGPTR